MASIGLKINQPYGGGVDTGVADVFAKAMFGDPEAAAKIALAKAQIATQQAAAANYGATSDFTRSKTAQNEAELAARRTGATSLGGLLAASVPEPIARETPRPMPNFQGPMPTVVQPADRRRHDAAVAAAPGIAEAALVGGGGNAKQIMDAALAGTGGFGLINPTDPNRVRSDATLYTGTAPSNNATLMPGDAAGAANEIAINAAKPSADKVIKDKAGNSYTLERGADGEVKATPVPGMPVVEPGASGPFEGDSAEMHYNSIVDGYNQKRANGHPTTADEDRAYAIAYNALYGDKIEARQNDAGDTVEVVVRRSKPSNLIDPGGVGSPAPQPTVQAPSVQAPAPASLAPTVSPVLPQAAPAAEPAPPRLPLPAVAAGGLSPLVNPGQPVAVSPAPAVSAAPAQSGPVPVANGPRVLVPSKKTTVPLTQEAARATAYYPEAVIANDYLSKLDPDKIPSAIQKAMSDPTREGLTGTVLRSMSTDAAKSYQDNAAAFTNGYLRLQSGAVIRPEEEEKFNQRYIPQTGDSKERLAAKKIRRAVVIMALKTIGEGGLPKGPDGQASMAAIDEALNTQFRPQMEEAQKIESGGAPAPGDAGGGGPRPRLRINPKTGKLEPTNGG